MSSRRTSRLITALIAALAACGPTSGSDHDAAPMAMDQDGDGIADADEGRADGTDTDGDGIPDFQDDDSDGDGIGDNTEAGDADAGTAPVDSDSDGTPDFRDLDSDGNDRPDPVDGEGDTDGDGVRDFADVDDDGDLIPDLDELGPDPAAPVDSDGDGTPDFRDVDSDGDTVADRFETLVDYDNDGAANFRDPDSDDDCRPDQLEAGGNPPLDSDGDGRFDFADRDADNDGLADRLEDTNCNGVRDGDESSPLAGDTDGDGTSDLVENAAGTNPNNPADNPQANGDFVFLVPYVMPPSPTSDTLDFSTAISQADVFFLMDTTGSMGGEIGNLQASLGTIIPALATQIPNVGIGVGDYRDFRNAPSGGASDYPYVLRHRIMTVGTAGGRASVQGAVNALTASGGGDGPESGWQALHHIATGQGLTGVGGSNVTAFNNATSPPTTPTAGESLGTIPGVGFRPGSLPIVIQITDEPSHGGVGSAYSFGGTTPRATALAELGNLGGRLIGVVSRDTLYVDANTDMLVGVNTSGARVPPSAWGATRPAGCSAAQCCTLENGAGEAPDGGGLCSLRFTIASDGSGLGTAVVDAVRAVANFVRIDVGALAADDPADAVDAVVAFVDRVQANPAAPVPCTPGLVAIDGNGDLINETFDAVQPGSTACFDVIPKMNTTVMPTENPQMFKATITVRGDGVTVLDTRDVFFLVPPSISGEPIN